MPFDPKWMAQIMELDSAILAEIAENSNLFNSISKKLYLFQFF